MKMSFNWCENVRKIQIYNQVGLALLSAAIWRLGRCDCGVVCAGLWVKKYLWNCSHTNMARWPQRTNDSNGARQRIRTLTYIHIQICIIWHENWGLIRSIGLDNHLFIMILPSLLLSTNLWVAPNKNMKILWLVVGQLEATPHWSIIDFGIFGLWLLLVSIWENYFSAGKSKPILLNWTIFIQRKVDDFLTQRKISSLI
jgi:hypothetical protein